MRILIVDDSFEARDGLKSILVDQPGIGGLGMAKDAADALGMIEQYQPDLVLVDAQLGESDGVELTHCIKTRWPGTKVLLLLVHKISLEKAAASGADGLLMKDSPREDIVRAVKRALGVGATSGCTLTTPWGMDEVGRNANSDYMRL